MIEDKLIASVATHEIKAIAKNDTDFKCGETVSAVVFIVDVIGKGLDVRPHLK